MNGAYYNSKLDDPVFLELNDLLQPLLHDITAGDAIAGKSAIRLMYQIIQKLPLSVFKEEAYSRSVIESIGQYLETGNIGKIQGLARKRKTDRLEMIRAIACDCLEYFSFLPMRLKADPNNVHQYAETIDTLLWVLKKIGGKENSLALLRHKINEL